MAKRTTEALKKKNVMNICESEESTYESVVSLITKNKSVVSFIQLGIMVAKINRDEGDR